MSVSEIYIIGDLNYNMLNGHQSYKLSEFKRMCFLNTVNKPTRISIAGNSTLLDVILSDSYTSPIPAYVFPFPNSDHHLVISTFNHQSLPNSKIMIQSCCLNEEKMSVIQTNIIEYFKNLDLSTLYDINARWNGIKEGILICIDKVATIKSFNIKSTVSLPLYDKDLVNLSHKKNRVYNKWFKQYQSIKSIKRKKLLKVSEYPKYLKDKKY